MFYNSIAYFFTQFTYCVSINSCKFPSYKWNVSLVNVSPLFISGYSECQINNGGCTHFCFNEESGVKCGCPAQHSLHQNNNTCTMYIFSTLLFKSKWRDGFSYDLLVVVLSINNFFLVNGSFNFILLKLQIALISLISAERQPPFPRSNVECDEEIEFKCGSGECISRDFVCSSHAECIDHSDEVRLWHTIAH